jgi:hypothetical protein
MTVRVMRVEETGAGPTPRLVARSIRTASIPQRR